MKISVVIPVGPDPVYKRFLWDCLGSVREQDRLADEILLIDDQAHLNADDIPSHLDVRTWSTPWVAGVAHAFNFGVALATYDNVVMLGSDDQLQRWALKDLSNVRKADPEGNYYWMDVKYSTGMEQSLPCHAAMVTKSLWRSTGGFPVHAAVGAPDHIFISMLMAKMPKALVHVKSKKPPYWYREHNESWTNRHKAYAGVVGAVRDRFTEDWEAPTWTR